MYIYYLRRYNSRAINNVAVIDASEDTARKLLDNNNVELLVKTIEGEKEERVVLHEVWY